MIFKREFKPKIVLMKSKGFFRILVLKNSINVCKVRCRLEFIITAIVIKNLFRLLKKNLGSFMRFLLYKSQRAKFTAVYLGFTMILALKTSISSLKNDAMLPFWK